MYPKKGLFLLFVALEMTHNIDGSRRKKNTAADNIASLLNFYRILTINSKILLALDGPNEEEFCNEIKMYWNVKPRA